MQYRKNRRDIKLVNVNYNYPFYLHCDIVSESDKITLHICIQLSV